MKLLYPLAPICVGVATLITAPYHFVSAFSITGVRGSRDIRSTDETIVLSNSELTGKHWFAQATLTADHWIKEALEKYSKGDYRGAIADYDKAISQAPENPKAYFGRGTAYARLQNNHKAVADYDKAIALNPEHSDAYVNRGTTYSALKEYPKAIADFDKAIALNPKQLEAYYNRGLIYKASKKYPKAIADFDKAIALAPKNAMAYGNRGLVHTLMRNISQAKQDTKTAAKLFQKRNNPEGYAIMTQFLQQLEKLSQLQKSNPEAFKRIIQRLQ